MTDARGEAEAVAPGLDAAYYQAVEEFFVSRRGDPLFLSSADWVLVHAWKTAGIPLRVVFRGIEDALDGHAHSWGRAHRVGSLRYCAAGVEAARERWERALALGREEGTELGPALEGFAAALERASGLGRRSRELAGSLAGELRARARAQGSARELESLLAASEGRLLEALREEDGALAAAEIDAKVDRTLAPYAGRMPPRVLAQVRADAAARRLLAAHGIPRLSLFVT